MNDDSRTLKPMRGWYIFWTANFIVAGSAFAAIAVIVLVRGIGDLRRMFADLNQRQIANRNR
jgi:hypothetical protein